MFFLRKSKQRQAVKPGYENIIPLRRMMGCSMEGLEVRQFLSASHHHVAAASTTTSTPTISVKHAKHSSTTSTSSTSSTDSNILFSAAPTAVQTGLQSLAGSTTIDASANVHVRTLGDGSVIYSTRIAATGIVTSLTVDASGNPITLPSGGHGRGFGGCGGHGDSANTTTFSALNSTVSAALKAQAPTGVTLAGTQMVNVRNDYSGNTIYSTTLLSNGTVYVLAVDSTGATVTTPTKGTDTDGDGPTTSAFSATPAAVQTGMDTLADITIDPATVVTVFTNRAGASIYSATVVVSSGKVVHLTVDSTGVAIAGHGGDGHHGGHGHGF